MKDIYKVHEIVEGILETNIEARNSDMYLYYAVCRKINPIACSMPFDTIWPNYRRFGLPNYDSVGRARRKIQETREDLKACKEVDDERFENFKLVQKYATE